VVSMEVNKIEKKYRLSRYELVKYQLITELVFFKKEHIADSDLELLIWLGVNGPIDLTKFCSYIVKKSHKDIEPEEFAVKSQNVRNKLTKLEKRGLVVKSDTYKKMIQLTPSIELHMKGNVLLDYKFLSLETN
jgi:hypothetical protein